MRRIETGVALLALCGSIWAVHPPAQAADVLTLEQAIALAGQNNRLVKNSSLDVDKAIEQVEATKMRRLPALSFRAQANQLLAPIQFSFVQGAFGSFPATGPIPAHDTTLETSQRMIGVLYATVFQPLLEQFSIHKNVELGELGKAVATEQLRNQRQTVVANIKRTYFGLIQTQRSLESAEENILLYRELERLVKEQVRQQKSLEADHLDMKARLADTEYNALVLRNSLAAQKEQLNELLGREVQTEFSVTGEPEPTETGDPADTVLERALQQRPDVRQAHLQVRQAEPRRPSRSWNTCPPLT